LAQTLFFTTVPVQVFPEGIGELFNFDQCW